MKIIMKEKKTGVNQNEINLSEFNLYIPLLVRLIAKQTPSLYWRVLHKTLT